MLYREGLSPTQKIKQNEKMKTKTRTKPKHLVWGLQFQEVGGEHDSREAGMGLGQEL